MGLSDLASLRRPMPGDGDGRGDGDESRGLLTMVKKRRMRLGAGVGSAGCWGISSPEDCCALASGAEVRPEVPSECPGRFQFQGAMLELYIATIYVYGGWVRYAYGAADGYGSADGYGAAGGYGAADGYGAAETEFDRRSGGWWPKSGVG